MSPPRVSWHVNKPLDIGTADVLSHLSRSIDLRSIRSDLCDRAYGPAPGGGRARRAALSLTADG